MDLDGFLRQLARARPHFEWRLEPDKGRGSDRREWARFQIRAFSDQPQAGSEGLDPVSAVCFAMTGTIRDDGGWRAAARTIGLPEEVAHELIEAANDQTWQEANGRRRPDTRLQSLRVDLIRAVETPRS